jgi:uncharacterized coiled-coil DUF342 family protein
MSAMPERWTDREIDALSRKVDGLSDRMDQRFEQVDQRFEQVDQRFGQIDAELREQRREMHAGFVRLDERFASIQRTMFGAAVAIAVALIGAPHL